MSGVNYCAFVPLWYLVSIIYVSTINNAAISEVHNAGARSYKAIMIAAVSDGTLTYLILSILGT